MQDSKIEWTDKTWNPSVGCDKVSAGCKECYAIRMAWRLMHSPHAKIAAKYAGTVEKTAGGKLNWTGKINFPQADGNDFIDDQNLTAPLRWKNKKIFVNSESDLFHEKLPFWFIDCVMAVVALTPSNIYQVLTKRGARMEEYFSAGKDALIERWANATYKLGLADKDEDTDAPACVVHNYAHTHWPLPNLWLGVSVEDQKAADERIPLLLQVPAAVRFLSCEPLLGPVKLWEWDEFNGRLEGIAIHHNYQKQPNTVPFKIKIYVH